MFVALDGPEYPANAFRYHDHLLRYTYRVDVKTGRVGGVDIDSKLDGEDSEARIYTLRGDWQNKEDALKAAQDWTVKYFERTAG